jgi:hypothetical protein
MGGQFDTGERRRSDFKGAGMRQPEDNFPNCLRPHIRGEVISIKQATEIAGRSESTIRNWSNQRGIGRRIAGGKWDISRVALAMLLDGDDLALRAYLAGDRASERVHTYFDRCGVSLPKIISTKSATSAMSATSARCT